MSPQYKDLNRKMWVKLEKAVRVLDGNDKIFETYVLTCPFFDFRKPIVTIGDDSDDYGIDVPIPHAFIKSVLAEDYKGRLKLWTFKMDNEELPGKIGDYLVSTYDAEQFVGGRIWDRVAGGDLHEQKQNPIDMWDTEDGSV